MPITQIYIILYNLILSYYLEALHKALHEALRTEALHEALRRTEQKEISTSFLGLVATPHKVARVMGALSPE